MAAGEQLWATSSLSLCCRQSDGAGQLFFFFFFALYLLSLHLKVAANARVPLYAGEVAAMTQVRPQETSVCVKMVVNWQGGKAETQASLFSFPCFYIPAPIFCSPNVINAAATCCAASRVMTLEVSHKHRLENVHFSATLEHSDVSGMPRVTFRWVGRRRVSPP